MGLFIDILMIGIATGAVYAIAALGYNLIFGVLNVFNFAHGATMMIGCYGALFSMFYVTENFWLACIVGLGTAMAIGMLIERLAVRPMRGNQWSVAVATIGCSILLENLVSRVTMAKNQTFPRPFEIRYYPLFGDAEISNMQILLVGVSLALMAGMVLFLQRTRLGKAVRVIAQSPDIARCVGIRLERVVVLTFALSAALGGAGGILNAAAYASTYPFIGGYLGLKGIVVLIVAGVGNMRGALAAGFLLGILEAFAVGYGGSTWRDFVAYVGLLGVLLVRPHGLFGEEGRVEREV